MTAEVMEGSRPERTHKVLSLHLKCVLLHYIRCRNKKDRTIFFRPVCLSVCLCGAAECESNCSSAFWTNLCRSSRSSLPISLVHWASPDPAGKSDFMIGIFDLTWDFFLCWMPFMTPPSLFIQLCNLEFCVLPRTFQHVDRRVWGLISQHCDLWWLVLF